MSDLSAYIAGDLILLLGEHLDAPRDLLHLPVDHIHQLPVRLLFPPLELLSQRVQGRQRQSPPDTGLLKEEAQVVTRTLSRLVFCLKAQESRLIHLY